MSTRRGNCSRGSRGSTSTTGSSARSPGIASTLPSPRAASALALAAAALIAAGARGGTERSVTTVVVSPDGDGVNDIVRLHVPDGAGKARVEAYAWGGRLTGWVMVARTQLKNAS